MASNPFDQFDAPAQQQESGNPFDQFDAPAQASTPAGGVPASPDRFAGDDLLSDEAIARAVRGEPIQASPTLSPFRGVKRYLRGIDEAAGRVNEADGGRSSPIGTMEALGTLASGAVALPAGTIAGIGTEAARGLGFTNAKGEDIAELVQKFLTYQPRSESGKAKAGLMGAVTAPITESGADIALAPLFAGEAQALAAKPARIPADARRAASGVGPVPGKPVAVAGAVDAGEAVPAAAIQAKRPAGLASVSDSAPTLEKLRADKNAAYKRSEDAGVQISEFSFKKLKRNIVTELGERVDPTLHPDTTAALKRIINTNGAVSLEKLDQLRQIANDAKGSIKPADQRLAAKVVESIDDYMDGISSKDITRGDPKGAAALVEARALNTRLKKGEQIEELFRRAEIKAGANYTQSGLENALRQEFKALALDAKKMKRFTPEERAAITKVAKGGKLENALRFMGKFAPTGVISATLSGGLGAILAGPAGAVLPLTGLASRAAATRMTLRNANAASEVVRRGRNALEETAPKQKKVNALLEY